MNNEHKGSVAALCAFTLWGLFPIYWQFLSFLEPSIIVSHRVLWSGLFLVGIVVAQGKWSLVLKSLMQSKLIGWNLVSGLLLGVNWLLYVWAAFNGHMVEAALGYYLNPFLNLLLGAFFFKERFRFWQKMAIALALSGVLSQVIAFGGVPWIALTLACTFSLYGMAKKKSPLATTEGLLIETLILVPLALLWILIQQPSWVHTFGGTGKRCILILSTGLATTAPLLLFSYAAKKIKLSWLGLLQYISPTLQFLIASQYYGEQISAGKWIAFGCIWAAIALFLVDELMASRRMKG